MDVSDSLLILFCIMSYVHIEMYLWLLKGARLEKKFNLDLKDINEHAGIDYEVNML